MDIRIELSFDRKRGSLIRVTRTFRLVGVLNEERHGLVLTLLSSFLSKLVTTVQHRFHWLDVRR